MSHNNQGKEEHWAFVNSQDYSIKIDFHHPHPKKDRILKVKCQFFFFFFLENLLTLNDLGLDLLLKMRRMEVRFRWYSHCVLGLAGRDVCVLGKRSPTELHPQTT